MAIAEPLLRHTPAELLTMPDGDHFELVDGQLVERNMGTEASWIAGRIFARLSYFNDQEHLGWALPADASYQCFPEAPERVRRPDASFIRRGKLPGERLPEGHTPVAPDLAVEVISPNDSYSPVRIKVGEYLRAGVQVVWIVEPKTRSIEVIRAEGPGAWLFEEDELVEDQLLPGFRCRVGDLFPPPSATEPPA